MTVREYLRPGSLAEAVGLLARHGSGVTVMAGGTIVMPLVNEGAWLPERVMSLRGAGLDSIEQQGDELVIGAAVTLTQLLAQDLVPLLAEAARNTASWSIRNMGTVGGNLFARPPGGDVAVALLALDGRVRLAGAGAERVLPLADFYTGFMRNALAPGELLADIRVPMAGRETAYLKLGRKHANTPAVVTVAVALQRSEGRITDARIALGAAGPHPIRVVSAEALVVGSSLEPLVIEQAAEAAVRECRPVTDGIASEWYRRRMVGVFVRRALEEIAHGHAHATREDT